QAEDGIRDFHVTGVQTCALPISKTIMHTEAIFEDIAHRIEGEIDKAEKSVIIAVAWFTNRNLFNAILRKSKQGCEVNLMITDDEIGRASCRERGEITESDGAMKI